MIDRSAAPSLGRNPPSHAVPCGWCHHCIDRRGQKLESGFSLTAMRFVVCAICGNKRCPHATNCRLECTGSNEPGQKGSIYA